MTSEFINRKVSEIIVQQLGLVEEDVLPESSFSKDLGADSLDLIELILALEEEFDIEISENDVKKFSVVQDIINYVEEKIGKTFHENIHSI